MLKDLAERKTGAEIAEFLEREIRPLLEPEPSPSVAAGEFSSADWPDSHPWCESLGLRFTRQGCLRAIARGLDLGFRSPPADPGPSADWARLELFLAEVFAWLAAPLPSAVAVDDVLIPAGKLCELHQERFPSLAKLKAFLRKHPEIRTEKPFKQRLLVRPGDLARVLIQEGLVGTESLERVPANQAEALAGTARRKAEVDATRVRTIGEK